MNRNNSNQSRQPSTLSKMRCNSSNQVRISHTSQQSIPKPFKPSIRVGYLVKNNQENEATSYREKKHVQPLPINSNYHPCQGVKIISSQKGQKISGAFANNQYISLQHKENHRENKKNIHLQARQRLYCGKQASEEIKKQFKTYRQSSKIVVSRISQKNKLEGYKNQGIKDILEYQYAGKYKDNKLAEKCTRQKIKERCFTFHEIHDFDFRKCKKML